MRGRKERLGEKKYGKVLRIILHPLGNRKWIRGINETVKSVSNQLIWSGQGQANNLSKGPVSEEVNYHLSS